MLPALAMGLGAFVGAFVGTMAAGYVLRRLAAGALGAMASWGARLDAPPPAYERPTVTLKGNVRDAWGCAPEVGTPAACPCSKHVAARVVDDRRLCSHSTQAGSSIFYCQKQAGHDGLHSSPLAPPWDAPA